MEYDSGYVDTIKDEILNGIERPVYSFKIGDDGDKLNALAPLEVIRFLGDLEDVDLQSRITKLSISGKKVVLLIEGEPFDAGFVIKGTDYEWEDFPMFQEHPLSLMTLMEICSSSVLKNSKLLSRGKPVATAKRAGRTGQVSEQND